MKRVLLSLSFILAACCMLAETRTAEQALAIAHQFVQNTPAFTRYRLSDLSLTPVATVGPNRVKGVESASNSRAYYIYNVREQGFVVVSGDDRFVDILGYSESGCITNENEMPDGLQYWLSFLTAEMNAAKEAGYTPALVAGATQSINVTKSVEPLIKTKWNQNSPYNDKLQGYMTGCVATGVAQVMRYWKYPASGKGSHQGAYSPFFSADFGTARYDWNNMLEEYGTGWESKQEVDAVATLMLHVGVATDMRWGKDQSGTPNNYAAYALHNFFSYNKNLYVESRDHMSLGAWKALLIQQLQSGHPLCYAGMSSKTGTQAGHFFVCDGYDAKSGKFHFNWGWSGLFDGYYAVTALEPGTGGIGAGAGQFNYYQSIFVNVQPDEIGEYQAHFDAITVVPSGSTKSKIKITTTGLTNNNTYNFTGSLGLAVYQADGTLYKYIASATTLPMTGFSIGASYTGEHSYEVDASAVEGGSYTICAAVWSDRDQKVFPLRANYTNVTYYKMNVSGAGVSFSPLSTEPNLAIASMELVGTSENTVYQNVVAHFRLSITNNSAIEFNDEIGVSFEQSRSKKGTISTPVVIPACETKTIDLYGAIPSTVNLGSATAKSVYAYDGTFSALGTSLSVTVKDESEADGIGMIQSGKKASTYIYNTSGQISSAKSKEILIINGKKYLNK